MRKRKLNLTILGILFYAFLAVGSIDACNDNKNPMDALEFVARIKDQHQTPLNERLVIVYINGEEVGRGISKLGKYEGIDPVPNDGLAVVWVANEYELTREEVGYERSGIKGKIDNISDVKLGSSMYFDLQELKEGVVKDFKVGVRDHVTFSVVVLPGKYDDLPEKLRQPDKFKTILKNKKVIVLNEEGVPEVNVKEVRFTGKTTHKKLKENSFPINNCKGNGEINQEYSNTQSFIHETSFGLEKITKASLPAFRLAGINLSTQLTARFNFVDREVSEETIKTNLPVPPRTSLTYTISWYEVWEQGEVILEGQDGDETYPIEVKRRLEYKVESKRNSCK